MPKRKYSCANQPNPKIRRVNKWTPDTPLGVFEPQPPSTTRIWQYYQTKTKFPGKLKRREFLASNLVCKFEESLIKQDQRNHVLCKELRRSVLFRQKYRIPIRVHTQEESKYSSKFHLLLVSSLFRHGAILEDQSSFPFNPPRINWRSRPLLDRLESRDLVIEIPLNSKTEIILLNPRFSIRVLSLPLPPEIQAIAFGYLEDDQAFVYEPCHSPYSWPPLFLQK